MPAPPEITALGYPHSSKYSPALGGGTKSTVKSKSILLPLPSPLRITCVINTFGVTILGGNTPWGATKTGVDTTEKLRPIGYMEPGLAHIRSYSPGNGGALGSSIKSKCS